MRSSAGEEKNMNAPKWPLRMFTRKTGGKNEEVLTEFLVTVNDEDIGDLARILVYTGHRDLTPYWQEVLLTIIRDPIAHDKFRRAFSSAVQEEVGQREDLLKDIEDRYRQLFESAGMTGFESQTTEAKEDCHENRAALSLN
jgi:hypothetical protein